MSTSHSELRNAVWQACTAIRNEHRDVKHYVEYTAILLFFKFYDDLYHSLPADIQGLIPEPYRWNTLKELNPRGFGGYDPRVLGQFRDFFDHKRWRGKGSFGIIFENFQFDIKHDEVLGRALLALDRIDFGGIDYDQKGDIYEFLIAKMADAGVKGEFFTPRPIVNMIIALLKPRFGHRVWDPACGTGGFLSRAYEEMLADLKVKHPENTDEHNEGVEALRYRCIFGNETEAVSARLARMNMILRGDGHSTILEFNSLDRQTYTEKRLEIRGERQDNPLPDILEEGGFDLVMANPPYGGSQAVCDVGAHFKPWTSSKKPEANFLQLMMRSLKPGGRCGVLMPEGILFRREEAKIRERLLKEFAFDAVVGLFKGAFEFADVKACILFFNKPTEGEKWQGTREVWIGQTNSFEDLSRVPALLEGHRDDDNLGRLVPVAEIEGNGLNMMISKYQPQAASRSTVVPLSGRVVQKKDRIEPWAQPDKEWPVYGVNNQEGVTFSERKVGSAFKSAYRRIWKGDFVYNPTRIHVGSVGRMPVDEPDALTSPEYVVFTTNNEVDPRYLLYLMRTDEFRERAALVARGSIKHRLYFECLEEIELPIPSVAEQKAVVQRLDIQRELIDRCKGLLVEVHKLSWLDEVAFHVPASEVFATSFETLVEDASDYIDPTSQPDTEWKVYGVSNEAGVRLGQIKAGRDFKAGRRYKRLIKGGLVYNPQRVNVGSIGLVAESDDVSIVSPYYPHFTCKPDLDPKFAFYLIKSPYFRRLIDGPEGAIGAVRHELFFSLFTQIQVPIPRLQRQYEIVASMERQVAAYAQVQAISAQAQATMRRIIRGLFGIKDVPLAATLVAEDESDEIGAEAALSAVLA